MEPDRHGTVESGAKKGRQVAHRDRRSRGNTELHRLCNRRCLSARLKGCRDKRRAREGNNEKRTLQSNSLLMERPRSAGRPLFRRWFQSNAKNESPTTGSLSMSSIGRASVWRGNGLGWLDHLPPDPAWRCHRLVLHEVGRADSLEPAVARIVEGSAAGVARG